MILILIQSYQNMNNLVLSTEELGMIAFELSKSIDLCTSRIDYEDVDTIGHAKTSTLRERVDKLSEIRKRIQRLKG